MNISAQTLSLFFLTSLIATPCVATCIGEAAAKESLKNIKSLQATQESIRPIENSCHKKKYQLNKDTFYILYKDPGSDLLKGQISQAPRSSRKSGHCLPGALQDIRNLKLKWTHQLIKKSKKNYGWQWTDTDIGPSTWLQCGDKKTFDYYSSLATFLREINQKGLKENCLYLPHAKRTLCFQLAETLPNRSTARASLNEDSNPYVQRRLASIDRFYMEQIPGNAFSLLNELNSHIIANQIHEKLLRDKIDEMRIYRDFFRAPSLLPLFTFYSVNYLKELKENSPEDYNRNITRNKANRKHLKTLFAHAEVGYQHWEKTLHDLDLQTYQSEKALWKNYLKIKKQLQL